MDLDEPEARPQRRGRKRSPEALRFRGGLVFKAHRLYVSLNSRIESNNKKEEKDQAALRIWGSCFMGVIRLRVGGVPREQKMLKGHLPRVIYHQVY